MVSKIIIALCVVTIATALPPPQAPEHKHGSGGGAASGPNFLPPWISAPWYQWLPCNLLGNFCIDCSTKFVCTKNGGSQKACTDPALPHCNLGVCSATPSEECAVPPVPDYEV